VEPLFTPVASLSYPHLAKAQESTNPNSKAKFSGTLVFSGKDKSVLAEMEAAARAVLIDKLGEKKGRAFPLFGGKGSAFRTDNAEKYPTIEEAITVGARSDRKPGLVYRHADPATITAENPRGKPAKVADEDIEDVFYPGVLVKAIVKPYWYDREGNKGIGWALNGIQLWAEGERLDSRVKAEDAFTADMSETPAALTDVV
jgi:hypothetical protein